MILFHLFDGQVIFFNIISVRLFLFACYEGNVVYFRPFQTYFIPTILC
jgi:hypothetical protein